MSILSLALCLLPLTTGEDPVSGRPRGAEEPTPRGEVRWHPGSYEEALAAAAEADTLLAIEFWANWCGWCQRHEAENLSDPDVLAALEPFVSYGANISTDENDAFVDPAAEALMRRFAIRRFPTIVFVRPDGTPEGLISGFLPERALLAELDRIRRRDKTISYFERLVREEPEELEHRYRLALLLDAVGDAVGYQAHIEDIFRLDPEGKSLPRRRMALGILREKLWGCMRDPDIDPDPEELTLFLSSEQNQELLCDGWLLMGAVMDELEQRDQARAAYRAAWASVDEARLPSVGNGIAWNYWLQRSELSEEDRKFALTVAIKATRAFEKINFDPLARAQYLDTLACCYYMNGKHRKAIGLMERCIEMDPDTTAFQDRLAQFEARG